MTTDPEIAGVCLRLPRDRYELTGQAYGTARLDRTRVEGRAPLARLVLALSGPVANNFRNVASFDLGGVRARAEALQRGSAGGRAWRALIVEHGLLAHPELVWKGVFPAPPASDDAPALVAALAELRRCFDNVTGIAGPPASGITSCDECLASQKAYDDAFRAKARRSRARVKPRLPRNRHPAYCVHVPLALDALRHLASQNPELIFDLLGWIQPAGDRFVLEENFLRVVLGLWLLGKGPGSWGARRHWGYFSQKKPRQTYYRPEGRRRSRAQAEATLAPAEQSALDFSASAWGIAARGEALLAPSDATEPVLDPKARLVVAPSFTLPSAEEARPRARRGAKG